MVKVGDFNKQIARTLGSRARMTAVRNNIAAMRGASYYPHELDRLNMEVKALGALSKENTQKVDRNGDGRLSFFERVTAAPFAPLPILFSEGTFDAESHTRYLERVSEMDSLTESEIGRLRLLNELVDQRKQMYAAYETKADRYNRAVKQLNSYDMDTRAAMNAYLKSMRALKDTGNDAYLDIPFNAEDQRTYTEINAQYQRESQEIRNLRDEISKIESELSALREDIAKQDLAIKEAAKMAGVEMPGVGTAAKEYIGSSIPPFLTGGAMAVGILMVIAYARGPAAPQRARRGSALDVFTGR